MTREAYVVAARRTPIGRVGGDLRTLRVESLAAPLLRALAAELGDAGVGVDDVVLGNAWGPGGNPARVAAVTAGLDPAVPGLTVDRQCASGLAAVNLAASLVASGAADCCLAGGVESASTAPWRVERPSTVYDLPRFAERARFAPDTVGDPDMGPAADALARERGVSRERQDAFALASHRKATAAAAGGRFDDELVPVPSSNRAARSGGSAGDRVTRDQSPRAGLTMRALARCTPVFSPDGTVTAGNASPVNDGAAVVAVVSAEVRRRLGAGPALRVVGTATAGVDPTRPGTGPVAATRAVLARSGRELGDVALVEITEAFAGQVLACLDDLGIEEHRVNVGGGAIALGHPWGASGAVLVVRLFSELLRRPEGADRDLGLATVAGAGGLGVATLLEVA